MARVRTVSASVSQRLPHQPMPWQTKEGALAFIDPAFPEILGVDLVNDLLRVAGEQAVSCHRSLSDRQMSLLQKHRVVSLTPEHWDLPEHWRAEKRKLAMWSMALETESRHTIALLEDEGISPIVLKGMATRYLDYSIPTLRHTGDLDLLIDGGELDRAVDLLVKAGYTRRIPERLDQAFLKGVALVSGSGIEVDLHTRLVSEVKESGNELSRSTVPLPHLSARALQAEQRLIHSSAHCFHSAPRLRRLSGLADMTSILSRSEMNFDLLRSSSHSLGLETGVAAALLVEAKLMDRDPRTLMEWDTPHGWERIAFARSERIRWSEKVYFLTQIEGTPAKARFLKQMALPGRDFVAYKGGLRRYFRDAK